MRFSENAIKGHWEGHAERDSLPIQEELAEAEKLLESASPSAWRKVNFLLSSALCKMDRGKEPKEYQRAVRMLRRLRDVQETWYNSQILSYRRAKAFENTSEQAQIRSTCQGVFSSPEDNRYYKVRTNIWR